MPKSIRIRTTVNDDKNVQLKLEQDFDLLEILSLKISKSDIYNRMCADYGVVVGRAIANGGFGIPNAKVSVFVPLTEEDENDPIISTLYPYKQVTDKNEEGYRYNLLPKISEGCNHTPTGNFFTADEVVNNPIVLEVFEKYYKYTTKTNESGDFMIWGVPLGTQTMHTSIDVSNIGCYSMRPYHFINQGVDASQFKSALEFKASENLDTLPQIIIQNKVVDVVPFWGDDSLCEIGISRIDFDLRDSGVEIIPSATFMGSIITDDDSNYISVDGTPSKTQGQLCNLTTGTGIIESVRHTMLTEDDGCTPKLEYFTLEKGGKVIDGNGSWVTQLPMNLDFIITNEYGDQVISNDPKKGIPTKAKYRFRISFDSRGSEVRNASYLVPNIREYEYSSDPAMPYLSPTGNILSSPSYSFSDNIMDYPLDSNSSWENSPAYKCEDYFYEFGPNKVYTVASFIDNYRKNIQSGANRDANNRWRFIGIKSINPPAESRCTDTNKEFPVNDAFRGGSTFFAQQQIARVVQVITILLGAIAVAVATVLIILNWASYTLTIASMLAIGTSNFPAVGLSVFLGNFFGAIIGVALALVFFIFPLIDVLFNSFYVQKKLYNYPNCEPCPCGPPYKFTMKSIWKVPGYSTTDGKMQEVMGDNPAPGVACTMSGFNSGSDNGVHWRGRNNNTTPPGCWILQFDSDLVGKVKVAVVAATGIIGVPAPFTGTAWAVVLTVTLYTVLVLIFTNIWQMFESLNRWRLLANIYTGLCQGIFNMKFSNNWVNGALYHFKFANKGRKLEDGGTVVLIPQYLYADRVVWRQEENSGVNYYYRSTPFTLTGGFKNQNNSITTQNTHWPINSSHTSSGIAPHCGINFPTTICELGPLDQCITSICAKNKPEDIGQCFFVDRLTPSSFQPTEDLLGREIERKIELQPYNEFRWSGINKWFGADAEPGNYNNRNTGNMRRGAMGTAIWRSRAIDGDIAQLLATNNMAGVSVYTNDIEDPYYGLGGGLGFNKWYTDYGTSGGITAISTIFPLLTKDYDLINCLLGDSFGVKNTQVVPYYMWDKAGPAYGNLNNDYNFTTSNTKHSTCQGDTIRTVGYQQGNLYYAPVPNEPEGNQNGDWSTPSFYGTTNSPPSQGQFVITLPAPLTSSSIRLGTTLFYYFGLRQGASAYDRFLNEYLPPKDDD